MTRALGVKIALAALLLVPLVGYAVTRLPVASGDGSGPAQPPETIRNILQGEPRALKSFALVDQDGKTFGPEAFAGRWTFVLLGFTHCADVCPFTLDNLARVRESMIGAMGAEAVPTVLFLSVDPKRDSLDTLKAYATNFDPSFKAATAPQERLDPFVAQIGAFYRYAGHSGDDHYHVRHSAEIYVIDPQVRVYAVLHPPLDPDDTVTRFRALTAYYASREGLRM
jgi:protein SCO1/2